MRPFDNYVAVARCARANEFDDPAWAAPEPPAGAHERRDADERIPFFGYKNQGFDPVSKRAEPTGVPFEGLIDRIRFRFADERIPFG